MFVLLINLYYHKCKRTRAVVVRVLIVSGVPMLILKQAGCFLSDFTVFVRLDWRKS